MISMYLSVGYRLTIGRAEGVSTEEGDGIEVPKPVQACLEASCTSHRLLVSALNVVDVVEVEEGQRVLVL